MLSLLSTPLAFAPSFPSNCSHGLLVLAGVGLGVEEKSRCPRAVVQKV
jgi:hypothetical protein